MIVEYVTKNLNIISNENLIKFVLNELKNKGFFKDEDISGKNRDDDNKFWIGHSDDGPPKIKIAANKPVGGIPIVTIGKTLYKGLFFKT